MLRAARVDGLNMAIVNEFVVHTDPDIMGGQPVFMDTRVLVKTLFDYVECGDSLHEFLGQFPSASREKAVAALEIARRGVEASARNR